MKIHHLTDSLNNYRILISFYIVDSIGFYYIEIFCEMNRREFTVSLILFIRMRFCVMSFKLDCFKQLNFYSEMSHSESG